ncbi:MAG: beta-lactamase family protein [Candidatus Krumholzibacteria bacterium]|nr:beta-lactamase family protein [Candidatus Krumholzibacteria bacterium]
MTTGHAFRIASNTKTYIAVSILRLVEEGKVLLDDPISDYLPSVYLDLLISDGYDPDRMKIRHMLTHTSGMYEHAGDEYTEMIMEDPGGKWTRLEQVRLAIQLGAPYGEPGEIHHYSDTGYILLGKILEEVTKKTMAQAMRDLIGFERLGLDRTWLESVEAVPPIGKRAGSSVCRRPGFLRCRSIDRSLWWRRVDVNRPGSCDLRTIAL